MLFTNLVLLGAAGSFALAAPAADSIESVALPSPLLQRGVPLEFNRTYTKAELNELAAKFEKRTPAASPGLDDLSGSPVVEKRAVTTKTSSVNGVFTCPHSGQISRSMRAKGAITSSRSSGAGTFKFTGLFNVDFWSTGDTFDFGVPPDFVDGTGIHHFCEHFGNVICAYQMATQFEGDINANNPPLGASTPFIRSFDGLQPNMREFCIQISENGNVCPAFQVAGDALCPIVSWSEST